MSTSNEYTIMEAAKAEDIQTLSNYISQTHVLFNSFRELRHDSYSPIGLRRICQMIKRLSF